MIETMDARVIVSREDLLTTARLVESRAEEADVELARLVLVRRFIAASFELTRTLRTQTQCALVNHYGTAGTCSLEETTEALFDALAEYASRCREVAAEARRAGGGEPSPRTRDLAVGLAGAGR